MPNKSTTLFILVILALFWGISAQAASTISMTSKAEVPTILELRVSEESQSELKFGNIQPSALGPIEVGPMKVTLRINSNIAGKYQVTQTLTGPLENANQAIIDAKNFKFKTSSTNKDATTIVNLTQVLPSAQTIYLSNDQGLSDTVDAEYQLTVPSNQDPGDYSTGITYTVSSI